jgi:hypothetical protein
MKTSLIVFSVFFLAACAQTSKPDAASSGNANSSVPSVKSESKPPEAKPAEIKTEIKTPEAVAAIPVVTEPAKTEPKPAAIKEITWTLKKSKLHGPGGTVAAKKISTIKNPKGSGSTSEYCHHYGKFAVVEVRSTDEKGVLDLFVRTPSEKDRNLCNPDYNGKYVGLSVLEGDFAGVAGDYAIVDGFDASEGLVDFQIFNLETGKEAYRSAHHPTEEFALTKHGEKSSLVYFAKVKVNCDLIKEGETCWKRVLKDNGIKKHFAAPDCKQALTKAGVALEEPVLVTVRARVADLSAPKLELLGVRATCAPAP